MVLVVGLAAFYQFPAEGMFILMGSIALYAILLIFVLWEFSRWRVRRKNPIVSVTKPLEPSVSSEPPLIEKQKLPPDFPEYI